MITMIYQAILVFIIFLVVYNMYKEDKLTMQINSALVIIPLLLRALLIK